MADLRIDVAAEFKGKKAFKEASTATSKLDKAVSKLGKQIVSVFAVTKIVAFGKASVKAFTEDERAATKLTTAVKNLGLAFAQPQIDSFLSKLESSSKVADDQLRPALQALLTTTGSLTKSQELLNMAIETSRGSGIGLQTVAQDLANAYVGNTRGLRKYNLGLSQTALKTASFAEIQQRLNKQFSGANAAYLDTYAGKLEALQLAAGNAQETIGKGLVDAIALIGGQGTQDIEKATQAMDDLAQSTANVIRGQAVVLSELGGLGNGAVGKIGNIVKTYFKEVLGIQALEDLGRESLPRPRARRFFGGGQQANLYDSEAAAAQKFANLQAKLLKNQIKSQKSLQAEQKKQNSLKKSGTVFDLEQIQLVAALKGKLSEEEKVRVQAQLALLNGNEAVAKQLTNQILAAQDSTGNLAKFLTALPNARNPFEYLDAYLTGLAAKAAALIGVNMNPSNGSWNGFSAGGNGTPGTSFNDLPATNVVTGAFPRTQPGDFRRAEEASNLTGPIRVELVGNGDRLINAIAEGLQTKSLSTGDSSYINRRTGGFAG